MCLVLQGAKEIMIGEHRLHYAAGSYFIGSVALPVSSRIVEATAERPYIALTLTLDRAKLAELVASFPAATGSTSGGFAVNTIDNALLEPWRRLLALLDAPGDIPALAPMIEREILYRLLQGPQAGALRQIASSDSRLAQIRRAIAHLREHFDRHVALPDLIARADMSAASFHRHFKAITGMSPLQYQKRLRLQEARQQLLSGTDVASTAFAVGYESASQFSREYARLFGLAPSTDARRLRQMGVDAETIGGSSR